jgi:hypothetical protein
MYYQPAKVCISLDTAGYNFIISSKTNVFCCDISTTKTIVRHACVGLPRYAKTVYDYG